MPDPEEPEESGSQVPVPSNPTPQPPEEGLPKPAHGNPISFDKDKDETAKKSTAPTTGGSDQPIKPAKNDPKKPFASTPSGQKPPPAPPPSPKPFATPSPDGKPKEEPQGEYTPGKKAKPNVPSSPGQAPPPSDESVAVPEEAPLTIEKDGLIPYLINEELGGVLKAIGKGLDQSVDGQAGVAWDTTAQWVQNVGGFLSKHVLGAEFELTGGVKREVIMGAHLHIKCNLSLKTVAGVDLEFDAGPYIRKSGFCLKKIGGLKETSSSVIDRSAGGLILDAAPTILINGKGLANINGGGSVLTLTGGVAKMSSGTIVQQAGQIVCNSGIVHHTGNTEIQGALSVHNKTTAMADVKILGSQKTHGQLVVDADAKIKAGLSASAGALKVK